MHSLVETLRSLRGGRLKGCRMNGRTCEHVLEFLQSLIAVVFVVALLSMLFSCSTLSDGDGSTVARPSSEAVSFETEIKPIFEDRCVMCHNGHVAAGDLNLLTKDLAFRRSSNGPFFVPGSPERSKIFRMVRLADDEPGAMPPTGHALSDQELETIKQWITERADWPAGEAGYLRPTSDMRWRSR